MFSFFVLYTLLIGGDYTTRWRLIGKLVFIQPARFIFYILYFFLGILANKQEWNFQKQADNSKWLTFWIILAFISIPSIASFAYFFFKNISSSYLLILFNSFLRSFCSLSMLILLISWFNIYQNKSSEIKQKLSRNSYGIYLVHLPIVVGLQFSLIQWSIPNVLKFLVVSISSLLFSYLASEYFLRKLPLLKRTL